MLPGLGVQNEDLAFLLSSPTLPSFRLLASQEDSRAGMINFLILWSVISPVMFGFADRSCFVFVFSFAYFSWFW